MNSISLHCGLVNAKIRASDKNLPAQTKSSKILCLVCNCNLRQKKAGVKEELISAKMVTESGSVLDTYYTT